MSGAGMTILVRETAGIARTNEPVRVAVPVPRGALSPEQEIVVAGPEGPTPSQKCVLKKWADGSIKWLLIDFLASAAGRGEGEYAVLSGGADCAGGVPVHTLEILSGADSWQVDTGRACFVIDARTFRPFTSVLVAGQEAARQPEVSCSLRIGDGEVAVASVDAVSLEESGALRAVIAVAGHFGTPAPNRLLFRCRLHFTAGSSAVRIEFTLHNPRAARHNGGLWDLGDEGSLLFKELVFSFAAGGPGAETHCIAAPGSAALSPAAASRFSLYQESSGGNSWQSPVHRNREGRVPMRRRGYLAELDALEVASGERATPVLWHGRGDAGIAVAVPRFWQEFPWELSCADGRVEVVPFPARFPDLHELQGGEEKTQEFWVDFAAEREGLVWALEPLKAHAIPEVYRRSGVIQDLPGEEDLVDRFVTADDILEKRESADEYGWRNFGEIYADHEAAFHQGSEIFVSHYNNQYDFLAGLYRKFFATGDLRWQELAADLARHVRDIDLYHTDLDREEYNHGLFWHTDHYLDAGTSTHRSCSREHLKQKPAHLCGGGPGAEHCYTTGLMLHYFQTGNPDFKEAVVDLANWELLALAGPQTILAALKRGVDNLKRWRAQHGSRSLFPRFPLTRGTGNAITACLDAFEVGGGREFLGQAEELIRNTLHPEDDIEARNLLDPEIAWSYTVLLGAVAKFLDKKAELGEQDPGFQYARLSLLAYADWMASHEYPYLDQPEILEYPNETWAAQDLRKSVIFYQAARYASSGVQHSAFAERARFFYEYSSKELKKHPSSRYSRPIALVLQNGWVGSRLAVTTPRHVVPAEHPGGVGGKPTPVLSLGAVSARSAAELAVILPQVNLAREAAWLKARLRK